MILSPEQRILETSKVIEFLKQNDTPRKELRFLESYLEKLKKQYALGKLPPFKVYMTHL